MTELENLNFTAMPVLWFHSGFQLLRLFAQEWRLESGYFV